VDGSSSGFPANNLAMQVKENPVRWQVPADLPIPNDLELQPRAYFQSSALHSATRENARATVSTIAPAGQLLI
jgi:hypothetical protein